MRRSWIAIPALLVLLLSGCGYNTLQTADEQIKAAWSEVLNQYQRRADLVPNLVETVKGFANAGDGRAHARHRSARARRQHPGDAGAGRQPRGVREVPGRRRASSPARCRVCWWSRRTTRSSSRTPTSATCRRSSKAPRTASRWRATATSRRSQEYNVTVRSFPSNLTAMAFGYKTKPNFTVENEREISQGAEGRFRHRSRSDEPMKLFCCCCCSASPGRRSAVPPLTRASPT